MKRSSQKEPVPSISTAHKLPRFHFKISRKIPSHIHITKLLFPQETSNMDGSADIRVNNKKKYFEVEVFWVVIPCSVVVAYQRLEGPTMLPPSSGRISQKKILAAQFDFSSALLY
jgi:hypothetical protein